MKKYNVICDLVMVTYDIGPSLSPFVAQVVAEIKKDSKVKHQLTPMGSILEGDWSDVMNLINNLFLKFHHRKLLCLSMVDLKTGDLVPSPRNILRPCHKLPIHHHVQF